MIDCVAYIFFWAIIRVQKFIHDYFAPKAPKRLRSDFKGNRMIYRNRTHKIIGDYLYERGYKIPHETPYAAHIYIPQRAIMIGCETRKRVAKEFRYIFVDRSKSISDIYLKLAQEGL